MDAGEPLDTSVAEEDGSSVKDASIKETGKSEGGTNPCLNAPADGSFCSVNLNNAGDPQTLYRCKGGVVSSTKICSGGCSGGSSGGADFCDPCNTQADGYYCLKALDPSTTVSGVVRCGGMDLITFQECKVGCSSPTAGAAKCN